MTKRRSRELKAGGAGHAENLRVHHLLHLDAANRTEGDPDRPVAVPHQASPVLEDSSASFTLGGGSSRVFRKALKLAHRSSTENVGRTSIANPFSVLAALRFSLGEKSGRAKDEVVWSQQSPPTQAIPERLIPHTLMG